ncbi:MAG: hypothetical protein ACREBU_06390 [Nitrososphaera sp.]
MNMRNSFNQMPTSLLCVAQAFAVMGIAFFSLHLYSYDLRVPFNYSGDSVVILMFIKGMLLNGWTFDIPQLSAPYGMSAAAFPMMTSFDWLVMKGISVFTYEPGLILNLFWLLTLVFSACAAMACMRLLGIGRLYSFAAGVLYAYLPFALLRNVAHLNLVYYLVPFLALLAINLASGLQLANEQQIRRITYLACVAQGFNYIYFSFFAVVLFIFAASIGYINNRSRSVIHVAAIAIGLIVGATIINLSPSFYSWHKHGKPPEMEYKSSVEAETYGTKIRKMLAPHQGNVLPVLRTWGKKDIAANYPNENENRTARLGIAGSVGFMLLLLISLRALRPPEEMNTPLTALAALSLFTLLVITVGGFGAVFNLLTVPDIRAYNRFSVFIEFFALAGLGIYLKAWYSTLRLPRMRWAAVVGVVFLICISLYDQLLDRAGLVAGQEIDISRYSEEKNLTAKLKSLYPDGVAILQLPMTGFPLESIHEKMSSYDHLRPFLWADDSIRWSWPSFSQRHRAWQDRISRLEGKELLQAAAYSGFGAMLIDRFAYKDQGDKLISALISAGGQNVFANTRYVALDLHQAAEKLRHDAGSGEFSRNTDYWLNSTALSWYKGFYGEEVDPQGIHFRWSNSQSEVILQNFADQKRHIEFSFDLASAGAGDVLATTDKRQWTLKTRPQPTPYKLDVDIDAGSKIAIKFATGISKLNVAGEGRDLYFYLASPVVVGRKIVVE